jgi:phosphatidylserine/phosphatidylglycerophosphate/cardiolipin synthase-like enzyme
MATPEQIAELEDNKYFPKTADLGKVHRADTVVTPYVDGEAYFGAIADVLDTLDGSLDRLYITSWRLDISMRLRPNPAEPTLRDRLKKLVDKDVDVRVIVAVPRFSLGPAWGPFTWNPGTWDPELWLRAVALLNPLRATTQDSLTSVEWLRENIPFPKERFLIDWGGEFDSRHEKCTIAYSSATGLHAFLGGIDYAADRFAVEGHATTPAAGYWHDVGVHLQDGAAQEVLANFLTRWKETATLPSRRYWYNAAPSWINRAAETAPPPVQLPSPPPRVSDVGVRIWRSYAPMRVTGGLVDNLNLPWDTLPPTGVREVQDGLLSAIRAAKRYVYIEDQGLNPSTTALMLYPGTTHRVIFPAIAAACIRGVKVVFVTQGFSPEGIELTDETPAMSDDVQNRIRIFLTEFQRANFAIFYRRDTKVHSKLMLVDDQFVSLGSANLWDRSQSGDESEVHAAIVDPDTRLIANLRVRLWREHFRPQGTPAADERLRDLDISLGYFRGSWGSGTATEVPGTKLVEILP